MPELGRYARELRARLWKVPVTDEVRSELDFHLEMLIQDYRARGLDADAARRAALERFGDVARVDETCRDIGRGRDREMWISTRLDELRADLRFAVRQIRTGKRFTLMAVITLAVGIGASTTIFGIADAVLFRPLPFRDADRLTTIWETTPAGVQFAASDPNYLDLRAQARSFSELGAFTWVSPGIIGQGEPERLQGLAASASFFTVLGVSPVVGRTFTADEDRLGGDTRVAVLASTLWQRRFGGDPRIVGRTIDLDGTSVRVIGVMPPGFDFPGRIEIWRPLAANPTADRGDKNNILVGRLAPGASIEQAGHELEQIAKRLSETYPQANGGWGAQAQPLEVWFVGPQLRARVVGLLAAVGLLLVMACVNVANLLLARASSRGREMAVRAALGAGRRRIIRQLLTESVTLAMLGGIAGVALTAAAVPLIQTLGSAVVPQLADMAVSWRVVAFGLAACMATGLVFGLAPALATSRRGAHELLKSGARAADGGRLRATLIVASVGLAMLLLVSAGLVGGSFLKMMRVELGFTPDRVLTASLTLPVQRYSDDRHVSFFVEAMRRLQAIPGVRVAGAINIAPLSNAGNTGMRVTIAGVAPTRDDEFLSAGWRTVTPGYFGALGIPLRRGRLVDESDYESRQRVVVINETLARRLFGERDPVGREIVVGDASAMKRMVVGVVGDTRHLTLDAPPPPVVYFPYGQFPWSTMWLVVRTSGDPLAAAAAVQREVWAIDKNLPLANLQPMTRLVSSIAAEPRLTMLIFGIFASAALVLAAAGLYGVIAYTVSQQTRELGVRLALGAQPGGIVRRVVGHGLRLAALGVVLGAVGTVAATGVLRTILYETTPTDPLTFLAVAALLLTVAAVASLVPARRAAALDPATTLRSD